MGIFDRLKQARETAQQTAIRTRYNDLQEGLKLERLKDERSQLEVRQTVQNQLKQEQRAVRDLKHPMIANVKSKLKAGSAQGVQFGLKTAGKVRTAIAANRARNAGNAFMTQPMGNSPFAPGSKFLTTGGASPLLGVQKAGKVRTAKKATRKVVTYYK